MSGSDAEIESVEWVYESDEPEPETAPGRIDPDKVAVPRSILYMQGVLLGVVALFAFALGVLFGSASSSPDAISRGAQPFVVAGRIVYSTDGQRQRPDEGSVVIALPAEHRPSPNERVSVEGLRPQDPLPNPADVGLRALQSMGGIYARTDARGEYRIRLPDVGSYFILFVSRHAYRDSTETLDRTHLAQMGRYFLRATELLGDRRYDWRRAAIQADETINAEF